MYINLFAIICDNFRLNQFTCTNLNKHVLMYETLQHHNNIWTPQVVSQEINRISEIKIFKKYSNRVFPSLFPRFFGYLLFYCGVSCFSSRALSRVQTDATLLANNSQHCWELLNLYVAKSLTGFKLCTTTCNNIQQHATGCTNGRNM